MVIEKIQKKINTLNKFKRINCLIIMEELDVSRPTATILIKQWVETNKIKFEKQERKLKWYLRLSKL